MATERGLYQDGRRLPGEPSLTELGTACLGGGCMAWIGLHGSDTEDFRQVVDAFSLPELAVEDAVHAHQRPKLEHYGDVNFLVLRPARYIDETETVEFGELHVFSGPSFVITVRHDGMPDLSAVRRQLEQRPELLRHGPVGVVHAILDRVVDDYVPVISGIENDIDEIEDAVFGQRGNASRRTYELTREVIAFQRAIRPLAGMVDSLMTAPGVSDVEHRHLRDVQDHSLRLQEQADAFRQLLDNILHVNLTIETQSLSELGHAQNEEIKRISGWAAILFAPTLVGTIYGMNFDHMPELGWRFGYLFALGLMAAVSVTLYLVFRRRRWI